MKQTAAADSSRNSNASVVVLFNYCKTASAASIASLKSSYSVK
jgi:hypothetical protein